MTPSGPEYSANPEIVNSSMENPSHESFLQQQETSESTQVSSDRGSASHNSAFSTSVSTGVQDSVASFSTAASSSEIPATRSERCIGPRKPHHNAYCKLWEAINGVKSSYGELELGHFRKIAKIGIGASGTVFVAELCDTKTHFAVKVENIHTKNASRIRKEIEVLQMLDYPLLPTLFFHCETKEKSYIVTEYCAGGDLNKLRQKQLGRCFREEIARFYSAEVLLALEYLHMKGVVYRDLKPENVLIRDNGHLMLTDFDLSQNFGVTPMVRTGKGKVNLPCRKCVKTSCMFPFFFSKRKGKVRRNEVEFVAEPIHAQSRSYVGTLEYLAPEIILHKVHGSAVDWWTFGVFLYELLYGSTPFKGSFRKETLSNVVEETLKFPKFPQASDAAKDLIVRLLVKDPQKRLGHSTGAAEIKKHPFFEGIQWALVLDRPPANLPRPVVEAPLPAREVQEEEPW